jgi:hypothetical protein
MKAVLSVTWELSTEHPASTYGQPVLVNRDTGGAYGPSDIVQIYEYLGPMVAARAVRRLARAAELTVAQQALVAQFVGSIPPR